MKTKTLKVLTVVLTVVMMIVMGTSIVFAAESKSEKITPGSFGDKITYDGTEDIVTVGGKIAGIIQTVGTVVAVLILIVLGIKYMMGSAEEKAEYKKTMMPYVIGAVLIFAASTIANMVYTFASQL